MTRVTERHLIQLIDDDPPQLVFIDEFTGVEVVKPAAEAQIVLDQFASAAENDEMLTLANADGSEWFVPADHYPAIEHALNYFIDATGARQARLIDTTQFAAPDTLG